MKIAGSLIVSILILAVISLVYVLNTVYATNKIVTDQINESLSLSARTSNLEKQVVTQQKSSQSQEFEVKELSLSNVTEPVIKTSSTTETSEPIDYSETSLSKDTFDVMSKSNWSKEDFIAILPVVLHPVVDTALYIEETVGVNAVYLVAVAITEVGWKAKFSGKNNYFNWSVDGVNYQNFETMDEFNRYSTDRYIDTFANKEFFARKHKLDAENLTITVGLINKSYAINLDKTVNWRWSEVVISIIDELNSRRH